MPEQSVIKVAQAMSRSGRHDTGGAVLLRQVTTLTALAAAAVTLRVPAWTLIGQGPGTVEVPSGPGFGRYGENLQRGGLPPARVAAGGPHANKGSPGGGRATRS